MVIEGASNNTVGGTAAGVVNIISGNGGDGVLLTGSTATGNVIAGNAIGIAADGTTPLGNASNGVDVTAGASGNAIGGPVHPGNVIAFNAGTGVVVGSGTGDSILDNSIFANGGLGIDLGGDGVTANDAGDADSGPNDLQNFPVLTSAVTSSGTTRIQGTLESTPNTVFTVQVYQNATGDGSGIGEGQIFVTSFQVTTDDTGTAVIVADAPAPPAGTVLSATATDPNGNTSEFGPDVTVS